MTNSVVIIGKEYNTATETYSGRYEIRALPWKEARELVNRAAKSKNVTEYMEDLLVASFVTGPVPIVKEKLPDLPAGLLRKLMDAALVLNDISREESSFLSS